MKTLYIIRGLPGSGKSTLAKKLCPSRHFEADQYFIENGEYKFDGSHIKQAHAWCKAHVAASLMSGEDTAVSNTFTQRWEYEDYLEIAKDAGYSVQIIELHGPWESVHGVPSDSFLKMQKRWQPHAA